MALTLQEKILKTCNDFQSLVPKHNWSYDNSGYKATIDTAINDKVYKTNCVVLVNWVLKKIGLYSTGLLNHKYDGTIGYTYSNDTVKKAITSKFNIIKTNDTVSTLIKNKKLYPGDILFFSDHMQIYIDDTTAFDGGRNNCKPQQVGGKFNCWLGKNNCLSKKVGYVIRAKDAKQLLGDDLMADININKNLMSINHTASKRSKSGIKYIVVHYVGALGDAKPNTDYYKSGYIGSSADFWVGFKGDIWQGNDYWNYYSWHCGGGLQGNDGHKFYGVCTNSNSVGIEMCVRKKSTATMNATDKDWYFESATIESTAKLVAYLMKELDVDIDHVIRHFDVTGKICPNPFVYNTGSVSWEQFKKKCANYANVEYKETSSSASTQMTYFVRKSWTDSSTQLGAFSVLDNAKKLVDTNSGYKVFDSNGKVIYEKSTTTSDNITHKATLTGNSDKVWMGWLKRESGSKGYRCTNGDAGHAQGAFQFDNRYALVPFMQYCIDKFPSHYSGFKTFIAYGVGSSSLVGNTSLASLWSSYCDKYWDEFCSLQDSYAYKYYYLEAKKYIKNLYGINMDNHSPAVKGTLWSMAIRSGALTGAKKFEGCNDSTSDAEMLRIAYSKYGSEDANRWTKANQYGDAINALNNNEYTLITTESVTTPEVTPNVPTSDTHIYRVRKSWSDSNSQLGSFSVLANAQKLADANPGYKVFDETGKQIYPTETTTSSNLKQYMVQVTVDVLNVRSEPNTNSKIVTTIKDKGKYTIVEEKNGWGKLLSGVGWISLAYTKKI